MGKLVDEYKTIEKDFFDLDDENHIAVVCFQYDSPEDIFDEAIRTKEPMMNQDFIERITNTFDQAPDSYKLNIHVLFDDMGNYDKDTLTEISRKNILLLSKLHSEQVKKQNRLALSLCALGAFFIVLTIAVNNIWTADTLPKQIIDFVLDIASTVPFWSAADIYFATGSEKRKLVSNLLHRFHGISFEEIPHS